MSLMMMKTNPITPPPELLDEWCMDPTLSNWRDIAHQAAQWGADQELKACCTAIDEVPGGWADSRHLRHVRRPKPPSLRKQAYDALDTYIYGEPDPKDKERTYNTIRRALEALDD
jgi:hypothetical protein